MKINEFNRDVRLLEIANRKQPQTVAGSNPGVKSFKETFARKMVSAEKVIFSKHAQQRLFSRGIEMTDEKIMKLSQAMDKAEAKGSKDTLILDDEAAYVASVPNRTIITAFSRANLQEGVFTSIDSAVIL